MEQSLKQRLLGVVVVTALAAIFVPMLFDDPVDGSDSAISELTIPPSPVAEITAEIEPPPESAAQVLQLPEPDYVMAEEELEEINSEPEPVAVIDATETVAEKKTKPEAVPISTSVTQNNQAVQPRQPESGQWYIQAASLSTEQRAVKLRDDLLKQGLNASYDNFKTASGKIFYRVRIGPIASEAKAKQLKPVIDKKNYVNSRVMQE